MRVALALALAGLALPRQQRPIPISVGLMQRYNPGVMEGVVAYRVLQGEVPEGVDPSMGVALTDCALIGHSVWLEMPNGEVTGPHPVSDCSAEQDLARHVSKGLAVEVSYAFARDNSVPIHGGRYSLPLDGPLPGVTVWPTRPCEPWYCFLGFRCR